MCARTTLEAIPLSPILVISQSEHIRTSFVCNEEGKFATLRFGRRISHGSSIPRIFDAQASRSQFTLLGRKHHHATPVTRVNFNIVWSSQMRAIVAAQALTFGAFAWTPKVASLTRRQKSQLLGFRLYAEPPTESDEVCLEALQATKSIRLLGD